MVGDEDFRAECRAGFNKAMALLESLDPVALNEKFKRSVLETTWPGKD